MIYLKKISALLLALLICFTCFSGGIAFGTGYAEYDAEASNTEFAQKTAEIIKNENSPSSMLRIIGRFSKKPSYSTFSNAEDTLISDDGRFVLQFSTEQKLLECLGKLNCNPNVIYAERDCAVYTEAVEETSEYLSWGVETIEADVYSKALAASATDKTVTVAIVDSGSQDIDFIKDKLVDGYDFFENDSDAFQDESVDSHGTFLASIIADCTRNLPVKIMPVRVLDSKNGSLINAINGIIYAVDNGADVINISLGATLNNCRSLEDAVNYAASKNVTVVVCAGNIKSDIANYCPAHVDSALTVTSINSDYAFSESFSNFGDKVDFAAPGENIIGYNASGEITALSGTSMSTAFVSAAAAMFRLDHPACNNNQVRDALVSCTVDYGDTGRDKYYGWGVLKLSNLANSDIKYVESVSLEQDSYTLYEGDMLEINPIISPADATDKSFTLSASNGNISINSNIITAVSQGSTTLTVTSNDGAYYDTMEITVNKYPELRIKNNPGSKTINYGETLRLTAETANRPEGSVVWWYVDGTKISEGEIFEIAPSKRNVTITAKLVDKDGVPALNSQGIEISDSETVTVNSGFFQKIISFFKNLFRLNRTVVQFVFEN